MENEFWRFRKFLFGILEGVNRIDGGEVIMKEIIEGKFFSL